MKIIPAKALAALITVVSSVVLPALHAEDAFKPFPAPVWVLQDVDGKTVSSDQLKGKIVVLDFWATWCGPCRSEIPGYVGLQKKYADAGLVIVGVSLDRGEPAVVKKFVEEQKINYQVVMGDDKIADAFGGVDAIPTTFIIDRGGTARFRKEGAMEHDEFEAILKPFLKP